MACQKFGTIVALGATKSFGMKVAIGFFLLWLFFVVDIFLGGSCLFPPTKEISMISGARQVEHLVKMNECEGSCVDHGGHKGKCELVRVSGTDGMDWGLFSYCKTAIKIDASRGMTVERLSDALLEHRKAQQKRLAEIRLSIYRFLRSKNLRASQAWKIAQEYRPLPPLSDEFPRLVE